MVERKSKGYRTADEVRGWLQHHGYALEHETAEAFRRAGFRALQGRTYLDRDEGKPRDIDVVIQVADDSLPVALYGVAECKARTLGAWIVREAPSAYDDDLWTPAGRNSLRQAGRDFAIDVAMSLPVGDPGRDYLPFSIVEAAERESGRTSSVNPAFDAGRQAVSAAGGWAAEL
jgi:hypothetical protein